MDNNTGTPISKRFRGYLPVIVDIETSGFDPKMNALLEIAAIIPEMDYKGCLRVGEVYNCHIKPFPGAELDQSALKFNGIDPFHPLRIAMDEKEALLKIFKPIRAAVKRNGCSRAILVGHNSAFDIGFLNASVQRTGIKRNPFHPFSTFDTVTLSGLAFGQTVLSKAACAAGLEWDSDQAHSARYDAHQTAQLFCEIVNRWDLLNADRN